MCIIVCLFRPLSPAYAWEMQCLLFLVGTRIGLVESVRSCIGLQYPNTSVAYRERMIRLIFHIVGYQILLFKLIEGSWAGFSASVSTVIGIW